MIDISEWKRFKDEYGIIYQIPVNKFQELISYANSLFVENKKLLDELSSKGHNKLTGESTSGKSADFDSAIRRFDPCFPYQFVEHQEE
jgi:heme oxygenase